MPISIESGPGVDVQRLIGVTQAAISGGYCLECKVDPCPDRFSGDCAMPLLVISIFTRTLALKQGVSSIVPHYQPRLEKIQKYLLGGDRLRKTVRSLFLKLFFFAFFAGDSLTKPFEACS